MLLKSWSPLKKKKKNLCVNVSQLIMAECSVLMCEEKQHENVPVYEFMDVNSKEFHIGTFRYLWLDMLNPEVYSYSDTAPELEDVEFIEELGIEPKTLEELKSICRYNREISVLFLYYLFYDIYCLFLVLIL